MGYVGYGGVQTVFDRDGRLSRPSGVGVKTKHGYQQQFIYIFAPNGLGVRGSGQKFVLLDGDTPTATSPRLPST